MKKIDKTYKFKPKTIKKFEEIKKECGVNYDKMLDILINNYKNNELQTSNRRTNKNS